MAGTTAAEAKSLLDAASALVRGELGNTDHVYIHGVRVFGGSVSGERVEVGRGRPASSGDFIGTIPLFLEMGCLLVPISDSGWGCVHGEDAAHERGGNSGREIVDKDVFVGDTSEGDTVLE